MKKRLTAVLLVVCLAVFFTFTACGKTEPEQDLGTQYSYSFETNGGTAVAGGTLYVNEYIPVPETPTRSGYEFTGWYTDSACTKLIEFEHPTQRMPAHDVVFYAGWSRLVSIEFNVNGGTAVNKIEGHAGDEIPASVISSIVTAKADSIFDGWYADPLYAVPYEFGFMPNESITVYAKWHTANKNVTVTLVDGEEVIETYTDLTEGALFGDEIENFSELSRADTDYTRFAGWAADKDGYYLIDANSKVPSGDITLYAIYRQKQNIARITVAETDYTNAAEFYTEKGKIISPDVASSDYKSESEIIKSSALTDYSLNYDYFLDAYGAKFDYKNDVVTGDMELHPDVYSEDLEFDYVVNSSNKPLYATVKAYGGSGSRVVVPETYYVSDDEAEVYGICPVAVIGESAFKGKTFGELYICDNVEIIEKSAFENCANLTAVTFPENLVEINDSAFAGCTSLADVTVNDNVYYFGYRVFKGTAFEDNLLGDNDGAIYISDLNENIVSDTLYYYNGEFSSDAEITLGRAGLMCIAGGAFENKDNLASVTVAGSIYIIGDGAFKGCADLKEVVLGGNIQYIRASAFEGCTSLETVDQTSNERLRYVGALAFKGCTSLTSFVMGRYLATLGESAFEGCTSLAEVSVYIARADNGDGTYSMIMSALTAIPARAFKGCTSLTEFMCMDYVASVGESAFEGCTSLKYVTLGATTNSALASIGANAFNGCNAIRSVMIAAVATSTTNCPKIDATAFSGASGKIFVFGYFLNVYKEAYPAYAGRLNAYEGNAPTITVGDKNGEYEKTVSPSDNFDVSELVKKVCTITDKVTTDSDAYYTQDEDLEITVSVALNNVTLNALDEAGTIFKLDKAGTYVITVTVTDECGNSASASFDVIVLPNTIL